MVSQLCKDASYFFFSYLLPADDLPAEGVCNSLDPCDEVSIRVILVHALTFHPARNRVGVSPAVRVDLVPAKVHEGLGEKTGANLTPC